MLFAKNKDTIKAIEPIFLTQYRSDLKFKSLKKKGFSIFFPKNFNDSIHRFLKNVVFIRSFNVNCSAYNDTTHSCFSHCAT